MWHGLHVLSGFVTFSEEQSVIDALASSHSLNGRYSCTPKACAAVMSVPC